MKESKAEVERTQRKAANEATRDLAAQTAKVDSLKTKVKQYSDYDEIKRELEIMKVS